MTNLLFEKNLHYLSLKGFSEVATIQNELSNYSVLINNDDLEVCRDSKPLFTWNALRPKDRLDQQIQFKRLIRSARFKADNPSPISQDEFIHLTLDKHGAPWINNNTGLNAENLTDERIFHDLILCGSLILVDLKPLIEMLNIGSDSKISSISLIETSYAHLGIALHCFDLEEFIETLNDLGISFTFLIDKERDRAQDRVLSNFSALNPGAVHGSVVIKSSYVDADVEFIYNWLFSESGLGHRVAGTFGTSSDEFNQIYQSIKNRYEARYFLKRGERPAFQHRCLLTASGPSLDDQISTIARIKDELCIISAGSSLGTLVRNGIIPDAAVYLERGSESWNAVKELIDEGYENELQKVHWFFSESVYPTLADYFELKTFFTRPSSASIHLDFENYSNSSLIIGGPEAANAAMEVAILSGFNTIITTGFDFACIDLKKPRACDALDVSPRQFNEPIRGNLGKTVYSQPSLLACSQALSVAMQTINDTEFIRIGNGVAIDSFDEDYLSLDLYLSNLPSKANNLSKFSFLNYNLKSAVCLPGSQSIQNDLASYFLAGINVYSKQLLCFKDTSLWDTQTSTIFRKLICPDVKDSHDVNAVKVMFKQIVFYTSSLMYDSDPLVYIEKASLFYESIFGYICHVSQFISETFGVKHESL